MLRQKCGDHEKCLTRPLGFVPFIYNTQTQRPKKHYLLISTYAINMTILNKDSYIWGQQEIGNIEKEIFQVDDENDQRDKNDWKQSQKHKIEITAAFRPIKFKRIIHRSRNICKMIEDGLGL